jgi:hypothetical protein
LLYAVVGVVSEDTVEIEIVKVPSHLRQQSPCGVADGTQVVLTT